MRIARLETSVIGGTTKQYDAQSWVQVLGHTKVTVNLLSDLLKLLQRKI